MVYQIKEPLCTRLLVPTCSTLYSVGVTTTTTHKGPFPVLVQGGDTHMDVYLQDYGCKMIWPASCLFFFSFFLWN